MSAVGRRRGRDHRRAKRFAPWATSLLLSCEHGGNRVPRDYAGRFAGAGRVLESHRGWDPGALPAARRLARRFGADLQHSTVTRLLVELNRSTHHPRLFSDFVRDLGREARGEILRRYYLPYREEFERRVAREVREGRRVVHVSVHSFTAVLNGVRRNAEVGLLYDPRRSAEREFCIAWQHELRALAPALRVRRNYPYRGKDDGFVTYLRRRFPERAYLGIEIELNQELHHRRRMAPVVDAVGESLERTLAR